MRIDGESSRLSLHDRRIIQNAALGGESATGVGAPEFEVTHK